MKSYRKGKKYRKRRQRIWHTALSNSKIKAMSKQGGYTWKSLKYKIVDFGVIKARK